jgi:hypothetical protein
MRPVGLRKYVERATDGAQIKENIIRFCSPLQHELSVLEERTVSCLCKPRHELEPRVGKITTQIM